MTRSKLVPRRRLLCAGVLGALIIAAAPLTAVGAERVVLGEYFTWNG